MSFFVQRRRTSKGITLGKDRKEGGQEGLRGGQGMLDFSVAFDFCNTQDEEAMKVYN